MDKQQKEIPISVLETEINRIDLANLLQNIVGDNIIILMIKYFMLYQYQNKHKYNSQLHTKYEFFLLKIRIEQSPKFKIKVRNLFRSNTITHLTSYKSIFFVFKLDNRWIVTSYMPIENMAYIWDFLDPTFSNISKESLSFVVDSLTKKYLEKTKIKKTFVKSAKNNFYSSKSLEILYVLASHFFDLRTNPLYLVIDESTLTKFSKKLVWLIFRLMRLKTDKIYFIDFFSPNQKNQDENYGKNKVKKVVQERTNSVPLKDPYNKKSSFYQKNFLASDSKKSANPNNFPIVDQRIFTNRTSSLSSVKPYPLKGNHKISNIVSELLNQNMNSFLPHINPSKNKENFGDLYKNKRTSIFQNLMDKLGIDNKKDFDIKQEENILNMNNKSSGNEFSMINFLVENPMLLKKMKMKLNQRPYLKQALKEAYEKDLKKKLLDRLNDEFNDLCLEEEINGFDFTYIN